MFVSKTLRFKTTYSFMGQATTDPKEMVVELAEDGEVALREDFWCFVIPSTIFDKICIARSKLLSKRQVAGKSFRR